MSSRNNEGCGCIFSAFYGILIFVGLVFVLFACAKGCSCSSNSSSYSGGESAHDRQVRRWHEQQLEKDQRNGDCKECHGRGYIIFCHENGKITNCKTDKESSRHDHVTCKVCGGSGKAKY